MLLQRSQADKHIRMSLLFRFLIWPICRDLPHPRHTSWTITPNKAGLGVAVT